MDLGVAYMWQLTCTVITTIWWRGALTCGAYGGRENSRVAHVHSNYYYMVEGSPYVWPSCVAINMHSNYYYMVEGSPHVWLTCGN